MKKTLSRGMDRRTFLKASGVIGLGAVGTFSTPAGTSASSGPQRRTKPLSKPSDE